jgi:pectinesterase
MRIFPTRAFSAAAAAILALAASASDAPAQRPAVDGPLLAPERIAALPAAERAAWEAYTATSRRLAQADRAALDAELRAARRSAPIAPPSGPDFRILPEMTDAWFRGDEARRMAESILSYQTPAGGWSKHIRFADGPRVSGQGYAEGARWHYVGTIDNGATTTQLRFLLRADLVRRDGRYRAAFLRGTEYLLAAQFPNGCWPQVYPLEGGYHDAATFNDDATLNVLRLLRDVAAGDAPFVPARMRARVAESVRRGVGCILDSQVVVDGRRTVWGAQHDPLTLRPVAARSFELAGLSGKEGPALAAFLMEVDSIDPRIPAAVRGAAGWMRENRLWGYARRPGQPPVPTPGAGPLWARFAEVGSNRALFANRDAVVRYDWRELSDSAWGYGWFTDEPAAVLARYDRWERARRTPLPAPGARPSAIVDAAHAGADGALVSGTPAYRTLGAALAAAPADGREAYVVMIRDGRYREKLSVTAPNVHLVGESREGTILTYDAAAGHVSPGGWTYGTRGSFTLRIAAPGFRMERMTVENAFDLPANAAKPDGDRTKISGTQGVALMLDEGSDRAVFRDCVIRGHQDTLFPNAGRAYFAGCTVIGSVDFIFGWGRAVFDGCDIVSRDRGSASNNGYITAPSTHVDDPYGFVFIRSRLLKESPSMAPSSVTLGRPWHPSGNPHAVGSAVFIDTWMDDHVGATAWSPMFSTDAAGVRVENRPEDARFFEYGSTGPGAVASPTRRVLTAEQAAAYDVVRVLDGWDPRS